MDTSLESRALIRLRLKPLRSEVKLDYVVLYNAYVNSSEVLRALRSRAKRYAVKKMDAEMCVAMDWSDVNK